MFAWVLRWQSCCSLAFLPRKGIWTSFMVQLVLSHCFAATATFIPIDSQLSRRRSFLVYDITIVKGFVYIQSLVKESSLGLPKKRLLIDNHQIQCHLLQLLFFVDEVRRRHVFLMIVSCIPNLPSHVSPLMLCS